MTDIEKVREAVNALDYIQHDWQLVDVIDHECSQTLIRHIRTLITAAQQRPEVVTVEEFLKVAWSHVTYDHKPIEAIRQAAEDVQKRFPHGLIIKSTERFR